ncbi:MAG: tRNA epoxyqueuosine(34) reductase QueG [Cyanobacteria bacterium]|nr:tRNA epoxyqueuosine(34) reductase QueG [Cyanobacteriota bacterium]
MKNKAWALGFSHVGIIPAGPLHPEGDYLDQWLFQGFQADMKWMEDHRDKRKNPQQLVENAQSIICVTLNYYPGPPPQSVGPDDLKIAKYAQGTDYHYVLKDKLKALLAEIQTWEPSAQGRAFTDSAPLMEKAMAQRAGLGWMGKNGNLITRDYGSWVFLGELVTNLVLDFDVEATPPLPSFTPNYCGTCTRCIDVCPTQAIVSPGVVDANRCLAYWTIESKADTFPQAITENLQGWVFGCDICQDVCPWNVKFAQPTQEPEFYPRPWNLSPTVSQLLALDEEQFREAYRKSPIKRTKLKGLQRNAKACGKKNRDDKKKKDD